MPVKSLRRVLARLALLVTVAALILRASYLLRAGVPRVDDFSQYWAAGRLNLAGRNPYSPDELYILQRGIGLERDRAIIMYNPPWLLAVAMPFGLLRYPLSRLAWLALQWALAVLSALLLWGYYGGAPRGRMLALALPFTYLPTYVALREGQSSILMLFGIAAFLLLERRHRDWLAGAALAAATIKPLVLALFWVALLLWVVSRRRWGIPLGLAAAVAIASLAGTITNHNVFGQYLTLLAENPPVEWATTTTGGFLRLLFGVERFWLQFVPLAFGIVWLLWYWARNRADWQWAPQMPLVVGVALVTMPYGWTYDLVLLLVPIIVVATWLCVSRSARSIATVAGGYVLINGLAVGVSRVDPNIFWHFWMAPVLLLWYLAARAILGRTDPGTVLRAQEDSIA